MSLTSFFLSHPNDSALTLTSTSTLSPTSFGLEVAPDQRSPCDQGFLSTYRLSRAFRPCPHHRVSRGGLYCPHNHCHRSQTDSTVGLRFSVKVSSPAMYGILHPGNSSRSTPDRSRSARRSESTPGVSLQPLARLQPSYFAPPPNGVQPVYPSRARHTRSDGRERAIQPQRSAAPAPLHYLPLPVPARTRSTFQAVAPRERLKEQHEAPKIARPAAQAPNAPHSAPGRGKMDILADVAMIQSDQASDTPPKSWRRGSNPRLATMMAEREKRTLPPLNSLPTPLRFHAREEVSGIRWWNAPPLTAPLRLSSEIDSTRLRPSATDPRLHALARDDVSRESQSASPQGPERPKRRYRFGEVSSPTVVTMIADKSDPGLAPVINVRANPRRYWSAAESVAPVPPYPVRQHGTKPRPPSRSERRLGPRSNQHLRPFCCASPTRCPD